MIVNDLIKAMTMLNMSAMMIMTIISQQIPGFSSCKTERIEIKQRVSKNFSTAVSNMLKTDLIDEALTRQMCWFFLSLFRLE
jgi:hypothetical protein